MAVGTNFFELKVRKPSPVGPFSERQEQILDGLQESILNHGFRSLRLSSVTKDLGTSFATLYQLAASKDELVALVIERWYQHSSARELQRLLKAKSPVARLRIWTDAGVAGAAETSPAFWRDVNAHPGVRRIVESYTHYWVEILHEILDDGISAKVFRKVDTQLLALIWESTTLRLGDSEFLRAENRSIGEISRNWVELVLHGILKD